MDLKEVALLAQHRQDGQRHPWEQARLRLLRAWLMQVPPPQGLVLDVGCGDAFVLSELARAWPEREFVGVDSEYDSVEPPIVPENVTLLSRLDQLPTGQSAAVVLLMDVLEHVEKPEGLLAELRGRGTLTATTTVVITVPAIPALFSDHDRYLGHYRRYTLGSLRRLLASSALTPLASGYVFSSLLVVRALELVAERLRRRQSEFTGLAAWQGGPLLTRVITEFLMLDSWLNGLIQKFTGLSLPGLTCFAVCRPEAGK